MALALQAASRESLADLNARLDVFIGQVGGPDLDRLADQLFSVARLLSGETTLRRHLADPAVSEEARTGLAERLLGSQLDRPALEAVAAAVAARWSRPVDLVNALESLARNAVLGSAGKSERLDEVEDELFRFGRILDREPELSGLLADTSRPLDGRIALLDARAVGQGHADHGDAAAPGGVAAPRPPPRRDRRGAGGAGRGPSRALRRPGRPPRYGSPPSRSSASPTACRGSTAVRCPCRSSSTSRCSAGWWCGSAAR